MSNTELEPLYRQLEKAWLDATELLRRHQCPVDVWVDTRGGMQVGFVKLKQRRTICLRNAGDEGNGTSIKESKVIARIEALQYLPQLDKALAAASACVARDLKIVLGEFESTIRTMQADADRS